MQGNNSPDRFGGAVKAARIAKGMTQTQLTEVLGITPRYLKAIENSGKKPSYDLLSRIIHELDMSADEVFYPEDVKKPWVKSSSSG
jgi:transcriptional regulator with XRE-family HTH domain